MFDTPAPFAVTIWRFCMTMSACKRCFWCVCFNVHVSSMHCVQQWYSGLWYFWPLRCFHCHCDMDHVSVNKNKLKHKDTRQLLSHNVLKSRLVNTVTTRFSTSTGQMTKIKKIWTCSSCSRNYDLTMQFFNTSFRQRGLRSVALIHYVIARRASTNHGTLYSAVSSNAETSAKYQLTTAWWNASAVRGHDNLLLNASKFVRSTTLIAPPGLRLATVTDGYVVLSWSFCCKYP